ncbi:MAG TPA: MFS transporter [Mariprofundaceae bacterium]|nr:MFS transporter [Mariprofundaceae bacterium]
MVSNVSLHHIRLFYAAYFAAMGLMLPFFPVYLSHRGLGVAVVGFMTGLVSLSKVMAPPLVGMVMDQRFNMPRFVLLASLLAALFAVSFAWIGAAWGLALVVFGFGFLWAAVLPLTDGLSVVVSEAALVDYGRLRVWGSIGFVMVSLAGGAWLADRHMPDFPYWLAVLMLIMAVAARGFPAHAVSDEREREAHGRFSSAFLVLMGISFLMQASHGAYYGFYSLYLLKIGYSGWQVATFWVLGVIAEIVLMWSWSRPIQRAAPAWVLGSCLLLASLRWVGIAMAHAWWLLALLQLLHAASFAAFHLNAVAWVRRLAPSHRHASAQGWYSSLGFGLGTTVGIMVCGWLSGLYGFSVIFLVCSGVALLGVPAAFALPRQAR